MSYPLPLRKQQLFVGPTSDLDEARKRQSQHDDTVEARISVASRSYAGTTGSTFSVAATVAPNCSLQYNPLSAVALKVTSNMATGSTSSDNFPLGHTSTVTGASDLSALASTAGSSVTGTSPSTSINNVPSMTIHESSSSRQNIYLNLLSSLNQRSVINTMSDILPRATTLSAPSSLLPLTSSTGYFPHQWIDRSSSLDSMVNLHQAPTIGDAALLSSYQLLRRAMVSSNAAIQNRQIGSLLPTASSPIDLAVTSRIMPFPYQISRFRALAASRQATGNMGDGSLLTAVNGFIHSASRSSVGNSPLLSNSSTERHNLDDVQGLTYEQQPQSMGGNGPFAVARATGKESFPLVLHRALAQLETVQGGTDIATFMPDGKCFQIKNQYLFEKQVLSVFFSKMKGFASFQRQLNLYDFKRIGGAGIERGAYHHVLFIRGHPAIAAKMKRTKLKGGPPRRRAAATAIASSRARGLSESDDTVEMSGPIADKVHQERHATEEGKR